MWHIKNMIDIHDILRVIPPLRLWCFECVVIQKPSAPNFLPDQGGLETVVCKYTNKIFLLNMLEISYSMVYAQNNIN